MRIVGPIFVVEIVTADRYQDNIQPSISLLDVDERISWLKHESATAHTRNDTLPVLHEFFAERIISRGLCSTRSPDS